MSYRKRSIRRLQQLSGFGYQKCFYALDVLWAVDELDDVSFDEIEEVATKAGQVGNFQGAALALAELTGEHVSECKTFFEVLFACQEAGYDLEAILDELDEPRRRRPA